MPLSTIDPNIALIVIDMQNGIVALPSAHPVQDVVARTASLAAAFRDASQPVVLVNVAGLPQGRTDQARAPFTPPQGWTDLIPELGASAGDHQITKYTPGAFTGTGLEAYLRERGITQVAIVGIATSNGVEVTGRQAYELGFHVVFPVDAMTAPDGNAHDHSVAAVFPKIGETTLTDTMIRMLEETQ